MISDVCIKCNGEIEGLKCEMCGEECSAGYDHSCGNDFLVPKCVTCDRIELTCNCGLE